MRLFLCVLALVVAGLVTSARITVTPPAADAILSSFTGGDSALAAAGSFKIYPLFTPGGAHIHAPQWCLPENGQAPAQGGYLFTSTSAIRVNLYGPSADTSGFTLPAGATFTLIPTCDSISVLNTGGLQTRVTWGLTK